MVSGTSTILLRPHESSCISRLVVDAQPLSVLERKGETRALLLLHDDVTESVRFLELWTLHATLLGTSS